MAPETKAECELEIAHVLFIDMVGYSKLAIDQQRELQDILNRVVRSTARFRAAESAGKLDPIADWRWDGAHLFRQSGVACAICC